MGDGNGRPCGVERNFGLRILDHDPQSGFRHLFLPGPGSHGAGRLASSTETGAINSIRTIDSVQLTPDGSDGFNPAFDVTPARLVTALITERGVAAASEQGLLSLYQST